MTRRRRRRADRGFTLLEIMIVLALIGLIAAVVGSGVYQRFIAARIKTAKLQVRQVVGEVQQAMLDDPTCPTIDGLVAAQLMRKVPIDPWGTPLVLKCPGEHGKDPVDVISAGPDKKLDTPDDIVSWTL
jgi:general secretion pathway protein G